MHHKMKLYESPFNRMKEGIKTLELRLYDKKRQKIELGDKITFTLTPNSDEKILTEVTGLLIYKKFSDMLDDLPTSVLGYKESKRDYLKTSMYSIYTPEQELEYGALGIRLKLI